MFSLLLATVLPNQFLCLTVSRAFSQGLKMSQSPPAPPSLEVLRKEIDAIDGNYTAGGTSMQVALTGQQSAGFPTYAADTLDRGYKNLSGTAAITTHLGGVELGARYYQATGETQYANAVYNDDFTAFQSFTPLNEDFSNSLFAVHASGDLTDIWHTRVTLSRVVDDLRQKQDDPYSTEAVGDFDYTLHLHGIGVDPGSLHIRQKHIRRPGDTEARVNAALGLERQLQFLTDGGFDAVDHGGRWAVGMSFLGGAGS